MPNSLVDLYRKNLAAKGAQDDRTDYEITQQFGQIAQAQAPELFTAHPDFAQEYDQIREANAPSLAGEFGKTLKGGTEGMASTYAGVGALAGVPGASDLAKSLEEKASENQPTIPTMGDIDPGEPSTLKRVFSKDTARYLTGKAGSFLPAIGEMAGVAGAGALVGSAIEPGAGTVAGAAEGAIEDLTGRGIIKDAIAKLLKEKGDQMVEKGLIDDASDQAVKDALIKGDQVVADEVTAQAKKIAGGTAGHYTNLINAYAQGAGGIYNETGRRDLALELGAVGAAPMAIPELSLPTQVVKKLFPSLSADAAQKAASDLVGTKTAQLLAKIGATAKATGVGTGQMVLMEASNIVAKNIADGKDALDLSSDQWKQLREATVGGALASVGPGALVGFRGGAEPTEIPAKPKTELPSPELPPAAPFAPPPETPSAQQPPALAVLNMSVEERQARLAELNAQPSRTPDEENERLVLSATTPRAALAVAPVAPPVSDQPAQQNIQVFLDEAAQTKFGKPWESLTADEKHEAARFAETLPEAKWRAGGKDDSPAALRAMREQEQALASIRKEQATQAIAASLKPWPANATIKVLGIGPDGKPSIQIDIPHPDADQRPINDRMEFTGSPEQAEAAGYAVPNLSVGTIGMPKIETPEPKVFVLPKELAGAKPRYGFGEKQFTLKFENPLDKALYIIAQPKPSARDADYLQTVTEQTGMTEDVARALGQKVRAAIKAMTRSSEPGQLTVPDLSAAGKAEAGTYGALHFSDAGFGTHEDFLDAYRKDGVHDVYETPEEFLSRLYCMGQAA